jgi:hypothetical protein
MEATISVSLEKTP